MEPCDNTIFEKAFDEQEKILAKDEGRLDSHGHWSINWTDICTKIIQDTGRYCERFASDIVHNIHAIEKHIEDEESDKKEAYVICGIRKDGVDHDNFVVSQLNQHKHICGYSEMYYRKVLAVKIEKQIDDNAYEKITMTLKEIGSQLDTEMYRLRNK